jgi:hypothetical protein
MNSATPFDPPAHQGSDVDTWLRHGLDQLTDSVNDLLDLDAGLRDAELSDRARSLDASLDTILDVDAGLRAILPDRPQPAAQHHDTNPQTAPSTDVTALRRYGLDLARRPARERLELRSQLPVTELRLVQLLAKAYTNLDSLVRGLVRDRDLDLDLIDGLYRARARARGLVRDLDLAHGLARNLDVVRALDFDLDRALVLARGLARNLDVVRDLARDRAPGLDRDLVRGLARGLARDRVLVRALACALDLALTLVRGSDLVRALARALARDRGVGEFDRAYTSCLAKDIAVVLVAVTDFTTADLTYLDVRNIDDLQGVQWSDVTTRWPPEWEDTIRAASVQIDPDQRPDLYEIREVPRVPHTVA